MESGRKEFDVAQFVNKNVIAFKNDETIGSTGPRIFYFSEDEMLAYYLHQYNLARPTLLEAKVT